MQKTVREIAALLGGELCGPDGERVITGVTNLEDAGKDDITFAVGTHLAQAASSRAAVVIVPREAPDVGKTVIKVDSPRVAFARLLAMFTPQPAVPRGVHPHAYIGQNVRLGNNVSVQAFATVADDAIIGDNTIIQPYVYVGAGTHIGKDCLLYPHVTVREDCRLGDRIIIQSGAVIGSDGFGYVTIDGRHHKVPQVGNVVIEDDVEVGANAAIDRATTGSTVIKKGTKIDNLVHVAHNVTVGENCFFVAQTGIAGSTVIGDNVTFAGQTGCTGHVTIGDNSVFAARSGIISDVPANSFYAGFPARPHQEWLRAEAALRRLPELLKKLRPLWRK